MRPAAELLSKPVRLQTARELQCELVSCKQRAVCLSKTEPEYCKTKGTKMCVSP